MKETITIEFSPSGEVKIEGHGFSGPACEKATAAFEKALGVVGSKKKKAEYHQAAQSQNARAGQ